MIGYNSFQEDDVSWRNNQGGLFPLSPPSKLTQISSGYALSVMKTQGALFLRWESDFDQFVDSQWWHVIKNTPDKLETLPKKTRYMIRKASKKYEAMSISREDVIKYGYLVYVEAYGRYKTHERMFEYEEFCEAIKKLPEGTEFWGVYDKEDRRLVAFSENYIESDICFYVTMWFEPKAMSEFVGYLLFHAMEIHYLLERNFLYVSDGTRSLSHDTNIHDFLISKFKFRKAYASLNVVYTPWLGTLVAVAYPFRKIIAKVRSGAFQKASVLLKQEEIRRQCSKRGG